jgi:heptosyltransferase-2
MRIVVRGTNWIGDAVMTIPALRKLRSLFPNSEITLQTRQLARGVFQNARFVDDIITPGSFLDHVRALRERKFDLAIIFPNSFESALIARLSGAKRSFGYAADRRSLLLTDAVPIPDWKESRHEVYYYLNLIDAVERSFSKAREITQPIDDEPRIEVTESERIRGDAILQNAGVSSSTSKLVAIAPGATNSRAKQWLPENFARLNDRLQSEMDATVILLGSKADKPISESVIGFCDRKPIDLTGATEIGDAAAILSAADLLVTNDMGLAHLAPAVGTETIVIFGPTNPVTTRPFSSIATVISASVECAPCMLRDCPIDHRCMTRISADEVFERAAQLLTNESKRT